MKPYYERGGIVLYLADCRDMAAEFAKCALVLADPPYGVGERCDRKSKGRGCLAECNDFPPVIGDDQPFDPAPMLALDRPLVLWGANHYANRLPPSPSWIVWDKREGIPSNDNADCEAAWTNLGGPARLFRHMWNGMIKASEKDDRRLHPTQKPVRLSEWIICRHTKAGDLIGSPYAGSGTDLVAAYKTERRAIGCELSEAYCEVAARRLDREMAQGDLFRKPVA